jgi:hypothetical protein
MPPALARGYGWPAPHLAFLEPDLSRSVSSPNPGPACSGPAPRSPPPSQPCRRCPPLQETITRCVDGLCVEGGGAADHRATAAADAGCQATVVQSPRVDAGEDWLQHMRLADSAAAVDDNHLLMLLRRRRMAN